VLPAFPSPASQRCIDRPIRRGAGEAFAALNVRLRHLWRFAGDRGVARRSLIVAAVVGTVLNLINQGDALLGAGTINWLKICLTFVVPYCVSSYGAISYRVSLERDASARKGR
jgi:hypothetical protein